MKSPTAAHLDRVLIALLKWERQARKRAARRGQRPVRRIRILVPAR